MNGKYIVVYRNLKTEKTEIKEFNNLCEDEIRRRFSECGFKEGEYRILETTKKVDINDKRNAGVNGHVLDGIDGAVMRICAEINTGKFSTDELTHLAEALGEILTARVGLILID